MMNNNNSRAYSKADLRAQYPDLTFENAPELLSTKQASVLLDTHPNQTAKMIADGRLPARRHGPRLWKVKLDDVKRVVGYRTPQDLANERLDHLLSQFDENMAAFQECYQRAMELHAEIRSEIGRRNK